MVFEDYWLVIMRTVSEFVFFQIWVCLVFDAFLIASLLIKIKTHNSKNVFSFLKNFIYLGERGSWGREHKQGGGEKGEREADLLCPHTITTEQGA